jgi:uncharacterized protein involved in outer membrane biogenesis
MTLSFPRPARWIAGAVLGLAVLAILVVALMDWNWLRGPIASRVTAATGRAFAIRGDLEVHWSWPPRVVANDIEFGNAAWARDPAMARARRVDATVNVWPLLAGRVELPELTLSQPRVALEVGRDGVGNWVLDGKPSTEGATWPSIGRLAIDEGTASYRDAARKTDLAFEARTVDPAAASPFGLAVTGKGVFQGAPASLQARGGGLLALGDAAKAYPVEASGTAGGTRFSIDGTLVDPLHLKGERLNLKVSGPDLALLFPILGIPLPASPAYRIAGLLDHTGDLWTLRGFKGTLGQSDLAGDISVDRGRKPQKVVATVVSKALVLDDLAGFIGARAPAQAVPRKTVLPQGEFRLERLKAADVDLRFRGEKIVTANLPLESMSAHLVVEGGVVRLAPLDFGVAGGNVVSTIEMDVRQERPVTRAQLTAKGLHLDRMAPGAKLGGVGTGTFGGRAALQGSGTSVAQMLATANGDAAVIMEGGSVGELALRMSNLDVANSLLLLLGGDRQVPVRCLVGVFHAVEGDFQARALVLDTPKVHVTGSGHVDLRDESLHLRLVSESKGFSLASLRGPIAVGGTFQAPVVRPELQGVAVRGGLAVALGVVTGGVGALLPLLDFGNKKTDSDCAGLLSQAAATTGVKASDAKPKVPAKAP